MQMSNDRHSKNSMPILWGGYIPSVPIVKLDAAGKLFDIWGKDYRRDIVSVD